MQEVLTTNFDVITERLLESEVMSKGGWLKEVDYHVYSEEDEFERVQSEPDLPTIFKLHGSADNERSMRITLSDVASRRLSEKRTGVLKHFLSASNGDLLVLGYGGGDDFDINPILSTIDSKKAIFYVQHSPTKHETAKLPKAFQGHHSRGFSILCDPDEIVDYLWRNVLRESWTSSYDRWEKHVSKGNSPKDWNTIIDEWARQLSLSSRLFITASILLKIQRLNESHMLFTRAKELFENLENKSGIAATLHQLGYIEQRRGNYDNAKNLYHQSLTIERKLGDQSGIASSLDGLGIIEQYRGDYDEARRHYNDVKTISEKLGDQLGIAVTLDQLGMMERDIGKHNEAKKLYEQSLSIKRKLGDQIRITTALGHLALLSEQTGRFDEAEDYASEALEIFTKIGNKPLQTQATQYLTSIREKLKKT